MIKNHVLLTSIKRTVYLISFFALTLHSCSIFKGGGRSDAQAQQEMQNRQNKAIDKEVEKYDKLYKDQTERQGEDQKKMIKKSRKKPKQMNSPKMKKPKKKKKKRMGLKANERSFFLWRWLGI